MEVSIHQMQALVDRPFPGGSYRIEHWENVLLHEVVAFEPLPGGIVHPIGLFHVPIAASGWTIGEIFELCHAESAEAVRAGEYRWELIEPLREVHTYDVSGKFTDVERKQGRRGGVFDKVSFRLELTDRDSGSIAARVTNSWLFLRSGS
jgi:hypothetical protein